MLAGFWARQTALAGTYPAVRSSAIVVSVNLEATQLPFMSTSAMGADAKAWEELLACG